MSSAYFARPSAGSRPDEVGKFADRCAIHLSTTLTETKDLELYLLQSFLPKGIICCDPTRATRNTVRNSALGGLAAFHLAGLKTPLDQFGKFGLAHTERTR